MINVAELILSPEFNQQITLRVSDKYGVNFEDKIIDSVVNPLSPQELLQRPEGERSSVMIKVFSIDEVRKGDRFIVEEKQYRAIEVNDRSKHGFYHSVATQYVGTEGDISGGFEVT